MSWNRILPFLLLYPALAVSGPADEEKTSFWTAAELKNYSKTLAPEVNEDHFAAARMGDFGSHYVLMLHRTANGPAELHAAETDFYVVQDGSATLVTGGMIENGKEVSEGEIRGSLIRGGKKRILKPGDTVNIPPNTPHQIQLAEGQTITYIIVKVRGE